METGEAGVAKRVVPRAPAEEGRDSEFLMPVTRHTLTSTLTNFAMMLSKDPKENWSALPVTPRATCPCEIFDGSLGFFRMILDV